MVGCELAIVWIMVQHMVLSYYACPPTVRDLRGRRRQVQKSKDEMAVASVHGVVIG